MLQILAITSPIYFIIALGFVATRFGLFVRADMRVFGKFVLNLALICRRQYRQFLPNWISCQPWAI